MEFDNRIDAGAGHKPEADLVEGSMAGDADSRQTALQTWEQALDGKKKELDQREAELSEREALLDRKSVV